MTVKAILCDLDGTLLTSDGVVDPKTVDAITRARNQGILFGLSTGRDAKSVLDLLEEWGINGLVDVIVGSGGGEILDLSDQSDEKNFPLDGSLIKDVMSHYQDLDVNFVVPEGGVFYVPKDDEHIQLLSKVDKVPYHVVDFDEFLKEPRQKVMLTFKPELMDQVVERSKTFHSSEYNGAPLVTASILFEYMDPRISKSYGIEKLMQKKGMSMEDVLAFGDQDNDYDMIKNCGIGVVMANGSDKTKSAADFITDDNDHYGIANYLNQYVLN